MHGAIHRIALVGQRSPLPDDADPSTQGDIVITDEEGHWRPPVGPLPDDPDEPVAPDAEYVMGFVSYPRLTERVPNIQIDAVAQVPTDTTWPAGVDLVVTGAGPHLDGRYEVTGMAPGPAVTRLFLGRSGEPVPEGL